MAPPPSSPCPTEHTAANEARNTDGGGDAAEAMDVDGVAATSDEGAALLPPAKDASPPRGPGARGRKSAEKAPDLCDVTFAGRD